MKYLIILSDIKKFILYSSTDYGMIVAFIGMSVQIGVKFDVISSEDHEFKIDELKSSGYKELFPKTA